MPSANYRSIKLIKRIQRDSTGAQPRYNPTPPSEGSMEPDDSGSSSASLGRRSALSPSEVHHNKQRRNPRERPSLRTQEPEAEQNGAEPPATRSRRLRPSTAPISHTAPATPYERPVSGRRRHHSARRPRLTSAGLTWQYCYTPPCFHHTCLDRLEQAVQYVDKCPSSSTRYLPSWPYPHTHPHPTPSEQPNPLPKP